MQQRQSPKPAMPNWAGLSKNLALWLLVALLAVFLFQVMGKQRGSMAELNYTEFSRQVDAGNIKSVEIFDGKVVKGKFRQPVRGSVQATDSPRS
jgi:ATP-dependent Zn protease